MTAAWRSWAWARRLRRPPLPVAVLVPLYLVVVAWTATWPDHPLAPDEALGQVMARSVEETWSPFAKEPLTDYTNGAFAPDPYGRHVYRDHALTFPPVGIGVAFEQGVLGPKIGRAITLGIGALAIAFLGWRLDGRLTATLAGALYLAHPAVLYFSGTYYSDPGGSAFFLAALALLEAARRAPWLAVPGAVLGVLALTFRVEYGVGLAAAALVGAAVGPLRSARAVACFYGSLAAVAGALWWLNERFPHVADVLFEKASVEQILHDPWGTFRTAIGGRSGGEGDSLMRFGAEGALQNAYDYFAWFFPLAGLLAVAGLMVRPKRREVLWVLLPLGLQALAVGYVVLPAWVEVDPYYGKSWLEASMVRYFLAFHATTALLGGMALAAAVRVLDARRPSWTVAATCLVAFAVVSSSVAHAVGADHGIGWANERRDWFERVEDAAEGFGEKSVFVGTTVSKVVTTRPVLGPAGFGYDSKEMARVAFDLHARGYDVYALEPWFWDDAGFWVSRVLLDGGHTYWTDTGVQVDCGCGEFARFYRLHATNATLANVERLDVGHFEETPEGLLSLHERSFFWEERGLHVRHGRGETGPVTVHIEYWDGDNATHSAGYHEAGYANLPVTRERNVHTLATWQGSGAGAWRNVTFTVPAGEIVNGPYFVSGGLLIRALEVRER